MFSENAAIGAGNSTNTVDLGAAGAAYPQPHLQVVLDTPLTDSQGLTVEVQTADAADGTFVTAATYKAVTGQASAIAERLPYDLKQFVQLKYSVTGTPTGKMTAGVVLDINLG